MVKRVVIGILVFALVCMTGFFIVIGVFGATFAGACISSAMGSIPTADKLPQETVSYLDGRNVKQLAEQNKDRYLYAQQETGLPWQVVATLHYREAGMNPNSSISNGAPLGSGVNVDGVNVGADANQDAADMAALFLRLAKGVYDIDVIENLDSMTVEDWGEAFLAYNRGYLFVRADASYTLSPYVMNGFDAEHMNMRWSYADTVSGVDGNKAGALATLSYIGGVELTGGACGSGKLISPVVTDNLVATSGFDFRIRSNGVRRDHNGLDLIGGSQIVAAADGVVTRASYYGGYGYAVEIDHGDGISTLYGHLAPGTFTVEKGDQVRAGDPLGTMGNSGDSEGIHLHFEYHKDGVPINPWPELVNQGVEVTWQVGAYPRNEKPGPQD